MCLLDISHAGHLGVYSSFPILHKGILLHNLEFHSAYIFNS